MILNLRINRIKNFAVENLKMVIGSLPRNWRNKKGLIAEAQ